MQIPLKPDFVPEGVSTFSSWDRLFHYLRRYGWLGEYEEVAGVEVNEEGITFFVRERR